jgi:hypothetical protein
MEFAMRQELIEDLSNSYEQEGMVVAEQQGTRLKLQYCVACEKIETEIKINLLMSGGGFYF